MRRDATDVAAKEQAMDQIFFQMVLVPLGLFILACIVSLSLAALLSRREDEE